MAAIDDRRTINLYDDDDDDDDDEIMSKCSRAKFTAVRQPL